MNARTTSMPDDPVLLLDQVIEAIQREYPDSWDRWSAQQLARLRRAQILIDGPSPGTLEALQANAELASLLGSELFSRIAEDPDVLELVADENDPWDSLDDSR